MMEDLIQKQNNLFGRITRSYVNLKKLGASQITRNAIDVRLDVLEKAWDTFQTYHEKILSLLDTDESEPTYISEDLFEQAEQAYCVQKTLLLDTRAELPPSTSSQQASAAGLSATPAVSYSHPQLPRINLPKYSGNVADWISYRDLFSSLVIRNQSLSNVERLHYLKTSLSDEAYLLLRNVSTTEENFVPAWEKLMERYENTRLLVNAHLHALLSLQVLKKESASDLKRLLDGTTDACSALQILKQPVDKWDAWLVYITAQKLDSQSRKEWETSLGDSRIPPEFRTLVQFLQSRVRTLEVLQQSSGDPAQNPAAQGNLSSKSLSSQNRLCGNKNQVRSFQLSGPPLSNSNCPFCKRSHSPYTCESFQAKSPEVRRKLVIEKNLCFNCLGRHHIHNCISSRTCRLCEARHHTLLHGSEAIPESKSYSRSVPTSSVLQRSSSSSEETPRKVVNTISANNVSPQSWKTALLATALVKVQNRFGQEIIARALIDPGSEASFISENLSQRLRVPRKAASFQVSGVGGKPSNTTRGKVSIVLRSICSSNFSLKVDALVLPRLTAYTPPSHSLSSSWSHLSGLSLADPQFWSQRPIDLLLGVDSYSQIMLPGLRRGPLGSPMAQQTSLGWILSGSIYSRSSKTSITVNTCGLPSQADHWLQEGLQKFWLQEEVTKSRSTLLSEEEQECENHFTQSYTRTQEGRFMVRLPFRGNPLELGNTFLPALRSMQGMERRFKRNMALYKSYASFLQEYEQLGHMTLVEEVNLSPSCRRAIYLPHHGVVRDSSSTTKLRVVFNGSQKSDQGMSLNNILHVGPNLLPDLDYILLRFRLHPIVFCTDLEKMFRQILVHPDDRDFQRILWRDLGSSKIKIFRLNTVTYGTACAPYLAQRTLRQLADDQVAQFPKGANVLREDIYMDDILSGARDLKEAMVIMDELSELLKAGGFKTHKWMSNSNELLKALPSFLVSAKPYQYDLFNSIHFLLGLGWQPQPDQFRFQIKPFSQISKVTKRSALSCVAQLFDPLGWLAPAIVTAKIFLQSLWLLKISWDEPLPAPDADAWAQIANNLPALAQITVPRWVGCSENATFLELHGFADASEKAYAAVVYLRTQHASSKTQVELLAAKTKVAPLKQVSLPRLELCAAVLLTRLISRILQATKLNSSSVYLWSDSTVTLSWIRSPPRRWANYVANRVSEIQHSLPNAIWQHVKSGDNPADCASRGLSGKELTTFKLWWSGPPFLRSQKFPLVSIQIPPEPLDVPELRYSHTANLSILSNWDLLTRYSNLSQLLKTTAWCLRYASRCGAKLSHLPHASSDHSPLVLSSSELERSRLYWVRQVQLTAFPKEVGALSSTAALPKSSKLIPLNPVLDKFGLLRVGGRLKHSRLSLEASHPLILPSDSPFTRLVVRSSHLRVLHGGTQLTLATIRESYWILRGRSVVKAAIRGCLPCTRYRSSSAYQLMGNLPALRVTPARPFLNAGVDYAGPISIRTSKGRGHKSTKGYIAVFVCFAVRAVHLEVVSGYTSEAFIAAYRRFVSRRGICATLTSDRGTNFVGADAELRSLFSKASKEHQKLASLLAADGTQWKFGPPAAPHFGGLWEAAVKSVKHHLRRVVGDSTLTYEEMNTLLCEIEACLNSRPIQPLTDDPDDLSVLTPGHFLIGASLKGIPEPTLSQEKVSLLSRWKLLSQMKQHFWQRWSREYLQQMQARSKWRLPQPQVQVGDIGLLLNELLPPAKWPLIRVVQVHPGDDGLVRVVTIRTATTTLKRPITKICFFPRADSSQPDS